MVDRCSLESCTEPAIASLDQRAVCRRHFLSLSYRRLDSISAQIREPQFHITHTEEAGRFLEDCMRNAADVACSPVEPENFEKAQVLDVLLWASELHGFLRRGPRVPAKITMLMISEMVGNTWEEKTETVLLSRHGLQVASRRPLKVNDVVACVRLDNGWRTEARVVWARPTAMGGSEAGLEFLSDENFWGLGSSGVASARNR